MKSAELKELNYQFKTNINMKTKTSILALTKAFFILLAMCCLFSSCHNLIYEKESIVLEISKGTKEYKYCYHIDAYPAYQCYYSNQIFQIGDTLRFCK
jgi:hypothetical protein